MTNEDINEEKMQAEISRQEEEEVLLSDEEKFDLDDKRSTIQDVSLEMSEAKDEDQIPY